MIQMDMLYKPSLNYIKKERFTGSYEGLRYLLEKAEIVIDTKEEVDTETGEITFIENKETKIRVCVWPEPFSFDKTEDDKKTFELFDFNQDGLDKAWEWIGVKQDEQKK